MQMISTSVNRKFQQAWREVSAPYSLGYRIKLLSQLATRKFQDRLEPFGLTPFHWVVLCCLWEEDGLATCRIGDRLQQVGGTITGVIDRMEERKLVRRERDTNDRRISRVWLTQEGRQLQEVLLPLAMEQRAEMLHGFSDADRQLFSQLVDQAIINLS
jgi:DNA-binding MarR family transcriptional regulator